MSLDCQLVIQLALYFLGQTFDADSGNCPLCILRNFVGLKVFSATLSFILDYRRWVNLDTLGMYYYLRKAA